MRLNPGLVFMLFSFFCLPAKGEGVLGAPSCVQILSNKEMESKNPESQWDFPKWSRWSLDFFRDFDETMWKLFPEVLNNPTTQSLDSWVRFIIGTEKHSAIYGPRMFKIEKLSQPVEVTSSYRARNKSSLDRIRIGSEALFLEVDYNVNSLQELIEFDPDLIPIKEWPEIWIVKRNRGGRTFKVGRVGSEDGRSYLLHVCSKIIFQQSDFLERISSLWPDFAQAIRRAKENEKGFATLPAVSQKTLGFKKDIAFAFNRGGEGISRLHIVGTRLALGPLVRQFYEVLKSRGLESGELNLEEIIHSSSNRFLKSHFRLGDIDFHMRVAYANEPSVPHYLVIEWLDRKSKKQAELLLSELKAFKEATDH